MFWGKGRIEETRSFARNWYVCGTLRHLIVIWKPNKSGADDDLRMTESVDKPGSRRLEVSGAHGRPAILLLILLGPWNSEVFWESCSMHSFM